MAFEHALKFLDKILDKTCIILSNYGDDSIALVQWLHENSNFRNFAVVSFNTGFSSARSDWQKRCQLGKQHVEHCGFKTQELTSKITFSEAVLGRNSFPTPKFQWCAALLKGLPLLDWLDEIDPACQSVILIAKRRETLPKSLAGQLPDWIEKSEHFNDRGIWYPIIEMKEEERNELLKRAGFIPLNHRSLECDPCVNSSCKTLALLHTQDIQKTKDLENTLKAPMFSSIENTELVQENVEIIQANVEMAQENIETVVKRAKEKISIKNKIANNDKLSSNIDMSDDLELFYRGCGNPFGCGI